MANQDPCNRPGCTGTLEDGYCNVCGMAAGPAGPPARDGSRSAPGSPARTGSRSARSASSGTSGSARSRSARSGRTSSSGRSRRGMLGAGLVEVPPVPYRDPATAILTNPEVPESKRFCSNCNDPVGRGRNGQPGRTEGFCRKCGARFSFTPKLAQGDLVGGQYDVLGCLAHGGLGWIYLARDHNVSDRWVVLKGLLDSGDADAMAAAVAERRFLATVEHPNIVKIYNFVQHPDPRTGTMTGYIVMEYVGGQSLKEIALRRRHTGESLPLSQVLAYGIEVLRALGYLHSKGLIYCDFKPDNVIQTEEQLKLIDLGGVVSADDEDSAIYGTVGYQAPEIAEEGPSISSDLYTVARALAVLSFDFTGFTSTYRHSLPDRNTVAVLAEHESFDRLLRRATDPDPDRRYWSAEELAEQITGVLREVLAAEDGKPRPAFSTLFGPEPRVFGTDPASSTAHSGHIPQGTHDPAMMAAALPVPTVDGSDPAAGYLAGLAATTPSEIITALSHPPVSTIETGLRLVRATIELHAVDSALALLDGLADEDLADWRVAWYRGLAHLTAAKIETAIRCFDEVYSLLPGELTPKMALAFCAESNGDLPVAARHYATVWRTDTGYISAAFGLARVRLAQGDRNGAVDVLESVPTTSSHYVDAQLRAIDARVRGRSAADLTQDDLIAAGTRLEALELDGERSQRFTLEVLNAALGWVVEGGTSTASILGTRFSERELRFGLERSYRALARLATDRPERVTLVDLANSIRPRTLV